MGKMNSRFNDNAGEPKTSGDTSGSDKPAGAPKGGGSPSLDGMKVKQTEDIKTSGSGMNSRFNDRVKG